MRFDARAAKQLSPRSHLTIEGCPGLRLEASAKRSRQRAIWYSTANCRMCAWATPLCRRSSAFSGRGARISTIARVDATALSRMSFFQFLCRAPIISLRKANPREVKRYEQAKSE